MHASQKLACVHHLSEVMLGSSMVNEKVQRIKFVCLQVIGMLYTLLPQASSHLSALIFMNLRRPPRWAFATNLPSYRRKLTMISQYLSVRVRALEGFASGVRGA